MHELSARHVPQEWDYVSPFDRHTRGFRPGWWADPFLHARNPSLLPYSFTTKDSREEAARVLLRADAGFTDLEGAGVSLPPIAIAVDYIEVRADLTHPRSGVGTQVVRLIERLYPDDTLFAFAEGDGAEKFWRSTGWRFVPRADGNERFRPLFVLDHG